MDKMCDQRVKKCDLRVKKCDLFFIMIIQGRIRYNMDSIWFVKEIKFDVFDLLDILI